MSQKKVTDDSETLFCSATRIRTGVYGVRGRCPRPLDDSTMGTLSIAMSLHCSKAVAKVQQIFQLCKFYSIIISKLDYFLLFF